VFAYGLDLFFTQLSPARKFDVLTEGFNYMLLASTLVAMGVAVRVLAVMSDRKALKQKWK